MINSLHGHIKTKHDLLKHLIEQQDDHAGQMISYPSRYTLGDLIDIHNHHHVSYIRMGHLAQQIAAKNYGIQD